MTPEPAYLVLAAALERIYAGRWVGHHQRHREQDASYLITRLEEAGYIIELNETEQLKKALWAAECAEFGCHDTDPEADHSSRYVAGPGSEE